MKRVVILDYGSGNVRSVYEMIARMNMDVQVSNNEQTLQSASHIVLPGVGAFGDSMQRIQQNLPLKCLDNLIHNIKLPFLGICVGMQVLADRGEEFGTHEGLGWIAGEVNALPDTSVSVPHIGWNQVCPRHSSTLLEGFGEERDVYFVHSYHFIPKNEEAIAGETEYGQIFVSSIQQNNIFGVQFHPEKSQVSGQMIFENFFQTELH